jgi:hypothetical protein
LESHFASIAYDIFPNRIGKYDLESWQIRLWFTYIVGKYEELSSSWIKNHTYSESNGATLLGGSSVSYPGAAVRFTTGNEVSLLGTTRKMERASRISNA